MTGSATQLSLLVKKEAGGEVSRYIHSLKRFEWPEIRGPIPTLTEDVRVGNEAGGEGWSLRGWDRVVMVSAFAPRSRSRPARGQLIDTLSLLRLGDRSPAAPASHLSSSSFTRSFRRSASSRSPRRPTCRR